MPVDWLKIATSAPPKKRGALAAGLSSGVDDLQGLGYSALAAGADAVGATGPRDWLNEQADRNQWESARNGRPDLERIEDQTPSTFLPYLGYQVAKQAPNIAASIGAGLVVPEVAVPALLSRGLAIGPRALGMGGMEARVAQAAVDGTSQFAARRAALEAGQTFGKQLVGGGAVNYAQGVGSLYQEANDGGDPNAGVSALIGGLPYALTETLPEAMLVGRIGHGSGFRGGLPTRMLKAGATQGAAGAASELAQNEMEMAYNGNVSDEQAFSRRLNSGVAGGLVEGLLGLGGGVRSRAPKVNANGKIDLLGTQPEQDGPPLQLGYTPENQQGYVVFPDGSVATNSDAELMHRYEMTPDTLGGIRSDGVRQEPALAAENSRGALPNVMIADQGGQVALDAPSANALYGEADGDPGLAEARRRFLEQQQQAERTKALQERAAQVASEAKALDERAQSFNVKGTAAVKVFNDLEQAHSTGLIDDAQFAENAGLLAASKMGAVKKFLTGIAETKNAVAQSNAAPVAPVQTPAPATPTAVAPVQTAVAGIDPTKTAEVGRAGRKQTVTPGQMLAKIEAAPELDKMRILAATGMDMTRDPTTGKPKLVQMGQPMTFAEVAAEEAQRTGKPVSRQAIQQALAKYGIDENVATQVAATSPTNVSAEELGIDPNSGEATGFRVEDRVSKVTGSGMVNTAEEAQLSPAQQRQVEAGLKTVRDGGFTPAALAQATKGLGQAAKSRLLQLAAKEMASSAPAPAPKQEVVKAPADAKVVDLREGNDARVQENVKQILSHPEAQNAANDWDETRVNWSDLPDTIKAEWVESYIWNLRQNGGELDFKELDRDQQRIERQFADYQGQQAPAGAGQVRDAGAGSRAALVAPAQEQGTGTYVGESGERAGSSAKPVVQVKPSSQGLPEGASKEDQAAYKRQANKVQKFEALLACLTR